MPLSEHVDVLRCRACGWLHEEGKWFMQRNKTPGAKSLCALAVARLDQYTVHSDVPGSSVPLNASGYLGLSTMYSPIINIKHRALRRTPPRRYEGLRAGPGAMQETLRAAE
eukprot:6199549-Pleurochrysis_carterae.AAC.1